MKPTLRALAAAAAVFAIPACYGEGGPADRHQPVNSRSGEGLDASLDGPIDQLPTDAGNEVPINSFEVSAPPAEIVCDPAHSGEALPARTAVMSRQAPQKVTKLVDSLINDFTTQCAACHQAPVKNGDFSFDPAKFSQTLTPKKDQILSSIFWESTKDGPQPMPTTQTLPASKRDPNTDPVLRLGAQLRAWFAQGAPADVYEPPEDPTSVSTETDDNPYLFTKEVGEALTNLGNCVPDHLRDSKGDDDLDALFASATSLPELLTETDLVGFDSAKLAEHGVVAYAPAYPLWSDNAHKVRHVRVPRGQSIRFDKATQEFQIPDNTRFYKTFVRAVVEKDGSTHYRKIETRLIVARAPNKSVEGIYAKNPDGSEQQNALFGTYEWNDDETQAILLKKPRNDGTPFADDLISFVTDDMKEETARAAYNSATDGDLVSYLVKAGARRHYAVPGSERCIQCHQGSPNRSFVLGFLPLQINWREKGVGGVIEESGPDELSQLERLIDYGVITGIDKPTDVLPLEKSQGKRKPRNDNELVAQGYLIGNCAHCHNPANGYPTVRNPELRDLLSFIPGPGDTEGIFQFPLERYSPRIFRGKGGIVKIPYITPSLVDYPSQLDANYAVAEAAGNRHGNPDGATSSIRVPDEMVIAPWRSLIYRNVDSPFSYSVDGALFPHMPMNVPGFDVRAPRILADWMVSIPALRKSTEFLEFSAQAEKASGGVHDTTDTDTSEQPYVEIVSGKDRYDEAVKQAQQRLSAYRTGEVHRSTFKLVDPYVGLPSKIYSRYLYEVDTSDIRDLSLVVKDKNHLVPGDVQFRKSVDTVFRIPYSYDPPCVRDAFIPSAARGHYDEDCNPVTSSAEVTWPNDGVPDRPHWVNVDSSEPNVPWAPRRSEWKAVLVDGQRLPKPDGKTDQEYADEGVALGLLKNLTITDAFRRDIAAKTIPFGLWLDKPECASRFDQAKVRTVGSYHPSGATDDRWRWMSVNADANDTAHVYEELPGAAVFNMVCQNCHGAHADAKGRQADTLFLMTGGDARVANFRDGLLGPFSNPGANRQSVFGPGDDITAKYVAWMALGGTEKLIPPSVLAVVATTPVVGHLRAFNQVGSANMLGPVRALCRELFGWNSQATDQSLQEITDYYAQRFLARGPGTRRVFERLSSQSFKWGDVSWESIIETTGALIPEVGDPELWTRLCAYDNVMPVRAVDTKLNRVSFIKASDYPPNTPVGTDRGTVADHLDAANLLPWCVEAVADDGTVQLDDFTDEGDPPPRQVRTLDDKSLPRCPPAHPQATAADIDRWAMRGAINAGFSVFLYLDKVEHGLAPVPAHDRCEELSVVP